MRSNDTSSAVSLRLQTYGPANARSVAGAVGTSQATLSRAISALGSSIERIGASRNTRYALRRNVRNLGLEWPVYRVSSDGRTTAWGVLRALHGGFRFVPVRRAPAWMSRSFPDGLFEGLPFFLNDARPQG